MIGVILRFRKEPVAYMADIEAMYHQVTVPEEYRSLLRFLYWPDGDLDAEPEDYEMCVHSFGAVSSGSCANYALQRTADQIKSNQIKWFFSGTRLYLLQHNVNNQQKLIEK